MSNVSKETKEKIAREEARWSFWLMVGLAVLVAVALGVLILPSIL